MSISEATGAQSFKLGLKDGKEYEFSILTMKDYGDIENDLKIERREDLKSLVDFGGGGKIDIEALKYIDGEVKKVNAFDELATLNGSLRMIYYSLKKNHKDLTYDRVREIVDISCMTAVMVWLTSMVEDMSKNMRGQIVEKAG